MAGRPNTLRYKEYWVYTDRGPRCVMELHHGRPPKRLDFTVGRRKRKPPKKRKYRNIRKR